MFDLEDIFGAVLDGMRDGVAVRCAQDQGLENEQVERALQHLTRQRFSIFDRHAWLQYTPIDDRPKKRIGRLLDFV